MKIIVSLLTILLFCSLANSANLTNTNSAESTLKQTSKEIIASNTTASDPKEGRGKRTLELGTHGASDFQRRSSHGHNRHVKSFHPSATASNRVGYFGHEHEQHYPGYVDNGYTGYHHIPQPQYLEAPEPIIEIIIKESNETLPPQPLPLISQPKKKEQVQVFYVKYQHDNKHGLIIEKPVAALSPTQYHQENDDHEEQSTEEIIHQVTLSPPLQTTTLRTIIHPDSEKYHSNSGIRVTFGEHDKYLVETKEESLIQNVVAPPPKQGNFHGPTHGPVRFIPNTATPRFGTQQPSNYYINHHQKFYKTNADFGSFQSGPGQSNPDFGSPPNKYQPFAPQPSSFGGQQNEVSQQQQQQPRHFPQNLPNPPPPQFNSLAQESGRPQFQHREQFSSGPAFSSNGQQFSQNQFKIQQHQVHRLQPVGPPSQQNPPKQHFIHHLPPKPQSQQHQGPYQQLPFNNQQQPFRPIPIPIHNPPSKPVAPSPSPPPTHQLLPSQKYNQQAFNTGFRVFNNAHLEQQQSKPQPQPPSQYRRPVPQPPPRPFPPQQISRPLQQPLPQFPPHPQPNRQPPPQSQQKHNFNQIIDDFKSQQQSQNFQQNNIQIQGGGLVQQPPPNLGPGPALQHQQQIYQNQQTEQQQFNNNQQFFTQQQEYPEYHPNQGIQDFIPGGEVIKSVSKYEQHITENVPFSYNQPLLHYNENLELNPNSQKLKEAFEAYAEQEKKLSQNIGPLAHNIGHLEQPTRQTTQQLEQNSIRYNNHNYNVQNYNQNYLKPTNVAPTTNARPGQSVSTIYSEVFPEFETQQQNGDSNNGGPNFDVRSNFKNGDHGISAYDNYQSTQRTVSQQPQRSSSTSTTTTTTQRSTKKPLNVQLPDEVPDDLRQQLLSSGILDNADISILDYDKVGDINLENLPQEHLANFYGAGGAAQISSSNKVLTVVKPNGDKVGTKHNHEKKHSADSKGKFLNEDKSLPHKENVEMKIVRFDSKTHKSVSDQYIKSNSKVLSPVNVDDQQYNRYLPLKINGAQFPIPDVEELKGKKVSSVVVLAPVDNVQSFAKHDESKESDTKDERVERDVIDSKQVKFFAGDALKQLIKKPSRDNYKRWLDRETKTDVDLQSVVLLVTNGENNKEHEIFMYDIASKTVNKLNGELSSAFVNVAEDNAKTQDLEHAKITDTGILEQLDVTHNPREDVEYDYDSKTESESSESTTQIPKESQISKKKLNNLKTDSKVLISSGYSVIKS